MDAEKRAVILRVHYRQHAYHQDNVLEDRALSVVRQEVVHPKTGETMALDVLGLGQDRLIMLNDIVRGEFGGTILYQGQEYLNDTGDLKTASCSSPPGWASTATSWPITARITLNGSAA